MGDKATKPIVQPSGVSQGLETKMVDNLKSTSPILDLEGYPIFCQSYHLKNHIFRAEQSVCQKKPLAILNEKSGVLSSSSWSSKEKVASNISYEALKLRNQSWRPLQHLLMQFRVQETQDLGETSLVEATLLPNFG